eukprot:CAMPEP_0168576126 /NCGR_PEP_ID=MMETSP0413-20121227/20068_1 /TAXON_ID=136452 /ORGANISM="Filamoeba nolandi, Strain NC-AS-23-1" /LENGTH=484 /DNA_ID=CAMNT_0008609755 /DNA_START=51 /DNA_END=1506 /DNA_ORIENTATION=+
MLPSITNVDTTYTLEMIAKIEASNGKSPMGIAVDKNGAIFIADTANNCLKIIEKQGEKLNLKEIKQKKPNIMCPSQLVFDTEGNLYITQDHAIRKISQANLRKARSQELEAQDVEVLAGTIEVSHTEIGKFNKPSGLVVDCANNIIYVCDSKNCEVKLICRETTKEGTKWRVKTLDQTKQVQSQVQNTSPKKLHIEPHGIVIDSQGNLLVADKKNHRICKTPLNDPNTGLCTWIGNLEGERKDGSEKEADFRPSPAGFFGLASFGDCIFVCESLEQKGYIRKIYNPESKTANKQDAKPTLPLSDNPKEAPDTITVQTVDETRLASKRSFEDTKQQFSGQCQYQKKRRPQEEKRVHQDIMKQLQEVQIECESEVYVIFPSGKCYGRMDILTSNCIIEVKRADLYVDAVGQIKRYGKSTVKDRPDVDLSQFRKIILLFNCNCKKGSKEGLCHNAKKDFASKKLTFMCTNQKETFVALVRGELRNTP